MKPWNRARELAAEADADRCDWRAVSRWAAVALPDDGLAELVQALACAVARADARTAKATEDHARLDRMIESRDRSIQIAADRNRELTRDLAVSRRGKRGDIERAAASAGGRAGAERDELLRLVGLTDSEWDTGRRHFELLSPAQFLRICSDALRK